MYDNIGGFMFGAPSGFQVFFGIMFALAIGVFAYIIIKNFGTWIRNNQSEVLSRPCKVVAKRQHVWGGAGDSSAHTNYYVTFEFEDGQRLELPVRANQFGLIAEGDIGVLTYQGTRFLDFVRN